MDDAERVRAVLERRWPLGARVRVNVSETTEVLVPPWLHDARGVVINNDSPSAMEKWTHEVRMDRDSEPYCFMFEELEPAE